MWNVPAQAVVDYADVHEMVTAVTFSLDGSKACVGTMKGKCRFYRCDDKRKLEYEAQIGRVSSCRCLLEDLNMPPPAKKESPGAGGHVSGPACCLPGLQAIRGAWRMLGLFDLLLAVNMTLCCLSA